MRTDCADVYVDDATGNIRYQTLRECAETDFTKQVLPQWGMNMDYQAIALMELRIQKQTSNQTLSLTRLKQQ